MNGYPKVFNIESDPHEEHNIGEMYEVGARAGVEGGGGIQGKPREITEPAGSEHDEILSGNAGSRRRRSRRWSFKLRRR